MSRFGDNNAAIHPHDSHRLAQHHLDLARIFGVAFRPVTGKRRRLDRPQIHQPALGLAHDLVGDNQNIAGLELRLRKLQAAPDRGR
jgi:hypothetical protein